LLCSFIIIAHTKRVNSTCFSLDYNWLLSCGNDKQFQWHCTKSGRRIGGYSAATASCTCLQYPFQTERLFFLCMHNIIFKNSFLFFFNSFDHLIFFCIWYIFQGFDVVSPCPETRAKCFRQAKIAYVSGVILNAIAHTKNAF